MKKLLLIPSILLFICFLLPSLQAQDVMQSEKKRRNVARINITNPVLLGDRSLVIGYERVLKNNQSFSINAGLADLPEFDLFGPAEDSTIQLTKNSKGNGFVLTGDYRFYLANENKHAAPRGVYIGPYATYATMGRENSWTLNTDSFQGDVTTDFNLSLLGIGAQLGYQFILWKRIALDFVMIGPGLGFYKLEAKLDTSLDPEDEAELYKKISEALNERFPGYSFAVDDVDFQKEGTSNVTSLGYRYVIHLGYLF